MDERQGLGTWTSAVYPEGPIAGSPVCISQFTVCRRRVLEDAAQGVTEIPRLLRHSGVRRMSGRD